MYFILYCSEDLMFSFSLLIKDAFYVELSSFLSNIVHIKSIQRIFYRKITIIDSNIITQKKHMLTMKSHTDIFTDETLRLNFWPCITRKKIA